MTKVLERKTKVGDVLKHEYVPSTGFCRESAPVDVDSSVDTATLEVGSVITFTGGKWIAYLDANVADPIGVLIDETVYDLTTTEIATDVALAVLKRGIAQVRQGGLKLDTTGVTAATAYAALEAANIEVVEYLA